MRRGAGAPRMRPAVGILPSPGPVVWRASGLNSAMLDSTNNLFLSTECGINRVAVRSTLIPGAITVTATRPGLTPAVGTIPSVPVAIAGGLENALPPRL